LSDASAGGLLVKPEAAVTQIQAEKSVAREAETVDKVEDGDSFFPKPVPAGPVPPTEEPARETGPRRFHGSVVLDATRVGRDAGRIADEVISHLSGLVGANVTVTLEVEAEMASGAPEHVVRTVTENCVTLKFGSHGFERE